jgi:hemoglobin-like flavoprotein
MSLVIDETARTILARSLPLLQANRHAIEEAMGASFRTAGEREEGFGDAGTAAAMLVGMLIAQGRHLADTGGTNGVEAALAAQRALGITGRHYSRFGDALVAVLGDVLGPNLPHEVRSVWCDAFWVMVRAMTAAEEKVDA